MVLGEFWCMWGCARVRVRLIGESSTDTELLPTHTCACTQSYSHPHCNLYQYFCFRNFYFRCYSGELIRFYSLVQVVLKIRQKMHQVVMDEWATKYSLCFSKAYFVHFYLYEWISGGFRGGLHPLRKNFPAKPNEKMSLHYLGWPQKIIFT
jgi:hypothetical protein